MIKCFIGIRNCYERLWVQYGSWHPLEQLVMISSISSIIKLCGGLCGSHRCCCWWLWRCRKASFSISLGRTCSHIWMLLDKVCVHKEPGPTVWSYQLTSRILGRGSVPHYLELAKRKIIIFAICPKRKKNKTETHVGECVVKPRISWVSQRTTLVCAYVALLYEG